MGAFWRGIPPELLTWSSDILGPSASAVETGTYLGDGVLLLSTTFSSVVSIERDQRLASAAQARFANQENILIVEGSSREKLEQVTPRKEVPALFWLDAHYSGGITAGADDPCPLMSELETILRFRDASNSIILVDDIRGAVGTNGWPTISEICKLLSTRNYQVLIIDDVLIGTDISNISGLSAIAGNSRSFTMAHNSANWSAMVAAAKIINPLTQLGGGLKNRLGLLFR